MSRLSMQCRHRGPQGGAALVVGLIMLVLVTLMLLTALNLGTSSFRSVSNMQYRNEAIAAAEQAIHEFIDTGFTEETATRQWPVDINGDDVTDYFVSIAPPVCIRATQAFSTDPSSLALPVSMSAASTWNTVWDISATVDPAEADESGNLVNTAGAGAALTLRSGVRVLLSQAQRDARCP